MMIRSVKIRYFLAIALVAAGALLVLPRGFAQETPAQPQEPASVAPPPPPEAPPPAVPPRRPPSPRVIGALPGGTPAIVLPGPPVQVAPGEEVKTELVPIQYADPQTLAPILSLFRVQVTANEEPKVVVLSGSEKAVAMAKEAVKQLDVPSPPRKNVELIVYLLMAGKNGQLQGLQATPPQLEPVVTQLEQMFGFTQLGLLDTLLLRGRDGSEVQTSGFLPTVGPPTDAGGGASGESPSTYRVSAGPLKVEAGEGASPRIVVNQFVFGAEVAFGASAPAGQPRPGRGIQRQDVGIRADVDVTQGQMAVVGKGSVSPQGETIFVVISARVLAD